MRALEVEILAHGLRCGWAANGSQKPTDCFLALPGWEI